MEPHSFSFYCTDQGASVQKTGKKAVAPPRPTPPQVYKVDPINFRDVVQKLTAAPEFQDRRLQAMPPPRPNVADQSRRPRDSSGEGEGGVVSYHGFFLGQSSERY